MGKDLYQGSPWVERQALTVGASCMWPKHGMHQSTLCSAVMGSNMSSFTELHMHMHMKTDTSNTNTRAHRERLMGVTKQRAALVDGVLSCDRQQQEQVHRIADL